MIYDASPKPPTRKLILDEKHLDETDLAYHVLIDGDSYWIPKAYVRYEKRYSAGELIYSMKIPEWLYKLKFPEAA